MRRAEARALAPMWRAGILLIAAVPWAAPQPASAQAVWESPRMLSPQFTGGIGLYYVRFAALPGDGEGVFATWSPPALARGLSLRAGGARGAAGTTAFFGGVDATGSVARHTAEQPVDLSWNAGAGLAAGEYLLASVPLGLVAGRAWATGPLWLSPYVGARAVLDLRLGDQAPTDDFQVTAGLDLGLDVSFDAARRALVRFSASLGDRSAIAVGMVVGG